MACCLACNCLNVQVHCKETHPSPISSDNVVVTTGNDPFLRGEPLVASLDDTGIQTEVQNLCRVRCIGEWLITTCINCGIDTHAVHSSLGMDRVLVSQNLEGDEQKHLALRHSPDFSPAFRIIVRPSPMALKLDANVSICTPEENKFFLQQFPAIHYQVTDFLKKQHDVMKERVRLYSNEQLAEYITLQSRVQRDQQLIQNHIQEFEDKLHESIYAGDNNADTAWEHSSNHVINGGTQMSNNNQGTFLPKNVDVSLRDYPPLKSKQIHRPVPKPTRIRACPQSKRFVQKKEADVVLSRSLDADGLFMMDGVNSTMDDVFDDSEDEEESDFEGASDRISENETEAIQYAASLPIAVPMVWQSERSHSHNNVLGSDGSDSEKASVTDDPERIAASIKALARSVQVNDGTEMFGDLPRPRLNTLG